jgi:hypothetical protein
MAFVARKRGPRTPSTGPKSSKSVRERSLAAVVPMPRRRAPLEAATMLADGRAKLLDDEVVSVVAHEALDPVVLRGAAERGDTVIVRETTEGWVVLGVLRTRPTPGIDPGDEYLIAANRVRVQAAHEVSLVAGAAQVALRGIGLVETIARDITARAASVHKIIGRMIHLN